MAKTAENNYSKHVVSQIAQVNEGAAIVKLLRRRGPMAQNQLSSVLGVTTPTMCRIVRRIQASDLVAHRNRQNQKTGPIGVALNPQTGHVIGIEYSPTRINLAAISFDGTLIHTKSQPLEIQSAKTTRCIRTSHQVIHG